MSAQRRQLLDGATAPADLLAGLDNTQRSAITTNAAPLAIIAGAGSGKTTVLTRRMARRLLDTTADPTHTVALTFSREAADELRRRLHRLGVPKGVQTGTFHSIALALLRDHALTTNRPAPSLATDRVRLLREALTTQRVDVEPRLALADIDWASARRLAPGDFAYACHAAERRPSIPAADFPAVAAAYATTKRRRGVIDFDDLLAQCIDLAASDRGFRERVQWRFRHFFVDEAQDLNPLQFALLESWRGGRDDVCLVGDPRQAIYGWNGSDPTLLDRVEQTYPGITVIRLTTNYRCSPEVVAAGASALACVGVNDDTTSAAPDGPPVTDVRCDDEQAEATWIADRTLQVSRDRRAADIAVLARTNDQLDIIERAIRSLGLTTTRGSGMRPVERLLTEVTRQPVDRLSGWIELQAASTDPLRRRVAEEADRYLSAIEGGRPASTDGFRGWVEERGSFDDLGPEADDAVVITTFHGAKGREWHEVIVAGAERGLVPHYTAASTDQIDEEARLLYVATTRAAHRLTYTWVQKRRNRPSERSPWLPEFIDVPTGAPDALPTRRRTPPDELAALRQWRAGIARVGGVPDAAVCSDRVLRSLHDRPPASTEDLAARLGITERAAAALRPLPPAHHADDGPR